MSNNNIRVNSGKPQLIGQILRAGAFLNGSLPPDQEALTNKDVKNASDYTTYYETNGDLWQKRNGTFFKFGTAGSGGQSYDIEVTKPTNADIRPEGSFWYYKNGSSIDEIYVCLKNDGLQCEWGLLDNEIRLLQKNLISSNPGNLYGGYSYSIDVERSDVVGASTTGYLKKNEYRIPTLPTYTDFNASSTYNNSNRFNNGSEINGGSFGMMKLLDNTDGAIIMSSDLGMGEAYCNMSPAQIAELSLPTGPPRTVRFVISPSFDGRIAPEQKNWILDNWAGNTDPTLGNQGPDKGYFFGSFYTNLTTGDIWFAGANGDASDLEWKKIYNASVVSQTSFLNFIIEPTISENIGGVSNFAECSFGSPTIKNSAANTPDFIINTVPVTGGVRIQYTGSTDKVFIVDFKITAETMAQNGIFEYALFKTSVSAPNAIDLSITVLGIDNAGINAYGHCSSSCTVNMTNGDEIHIGRRGINAAAQFITAVLLNFKITELK